MTAIASCGRCELVFIAEDEAEGLCPSCAAERDPLECVKCQTRLRVSVPRGLCGMCDPEWDVGAAAAGAVAA